MTFAQRQISRQKTNICIALFSLGVSMLQLHTLWTEPFATSSSRLPIVNPQVQIMHKLLWNALRVPPKVSHCASTRFHCWEEWTEALHRLCQCSRGVAPRWVHCSSRLATVTHCHAVNKQEREIMLEIVRARTSQGQRHVHSTTQWHILRDYAVQDLISAATKTANTECPGS